MPTKSIFILTCALIVVYAQQQGRQNSQGGPGQGGAGQARYQSRGAGGAGPFGPQFGTGPGVGTGGGRGQGRFDRGYGQQSGGGGMGSGIPLWLMLGDTGNMGRAMAMSSLFGGGSLFGASQGGGGGRGSGAGGLFSTPMGYMAASTMGDNMRTLAACSMMNVSPMFCLMGQNM